MKKNIFLWVAVFAVGVMSSCSVDKVVDQAEARYIGFDPFANKVTRGLNNVQFGHDNFSVFGQYGTGTPTPVFTNQEVEWVTDSWDYNPLKAWVAGQTYHFAAIAPYNASYAAGTNYNYTTKEYTLGEITVNATPTTQIDYMTATPRDNVPSGANSVSFGFNHILSKIDFIFKPKTDNTDGKNTHWKIPVRIDITKIELADVPTTNTYAADTWGALVTPEAKKATFTEGEGTSALVKTSYAGSGQPTPTDKTFDWLVVPHGTTSNEITKTLTITCDVYDAVTDGTKLKSGATASVDIKTKWAKNTYYTYTVSIGADILGANPYITFDVASVTNWTPGTSNSLNVPTSPAP